MTAWRLGVVAVVLVVGVLLGVTGPDTTPVDPGPFIGGRGDGGPR